MDHILKSYSREEIAAMGPGDYRFYLAEDVEREIGKLKRKLREETGRRKASEQWICNGNVPDESPDDRARSEWGIFG